MNIFVDVKYLNQISYKLPLFSRKSQYLYNCRCIICGDSSKKKNKARGYFYRQKNELFYKCHNCDASQHFSTFLKNFDPATYRQYLMEKYNNEPKPAPETVADLADIYKIMSTPISFDQEKCILDKMMDRVYDLPLNHFCRIYCDERKIPTERLKDIYFIDDIRKIDQLKDNIRKYIIKPNPRLILPVRNENGKLIALICRALDQDPKRYIIIKISEAPIIFGLDKLDRKKKMYVVEGPIDSLFLPNSLAVSGTSFNKIDELSLNKSLATFIIDNQPRNKEVTAVYSKLIDAGYNVMIWPKHIEYKDINDLVLSETLNIPLTEFIDKNTHTGLRARIEYNNWKKI